MSSRTAHSDHRHEGAHDVRGWKVRTTADDEHVGRVHDLVADTDGRARYLDVDLGERHVLVPVGCARIDGSDRTVLLPGVSRERLSRVPAYRHDEGDWTPEREREHYDGYDRAYEEGHAYSRPDYQSRDWGRGYDDREESGELARLDDLDDYEVADGDPDPRGWTVLGADDRELGKVDHLIGDTGQMRVRYLTVEVDRGITGDDRHVLVPIGHAELDRERERVVVRALDSEGILTVPTYDGATIDREHRDRLHESYRRGYRGEDRYRHPGYLETGLYGTPRERETVHA